VEILVESLSDRCGPRVTCVSRGVDALDVDMLEPHDVVICESRLPDACGIDVAHRLLSLNPRPVIMMGHDEPPERIVEAMRAGVRDFFLKPFAVSDLMDSMEAAAVAQRLRVDHQVRHRQLRDILRRALRQRRDLRERIDLVCKDLVAAHRRLVERVLHYEGVRQPQRS